MSEPHHPQRPAPPDTAETEAVVPVVAESLDVHIEEHVTGRVRVSTRTESVEREVEETLSSVTANVRRVPVGHELGPDEVLPETRVENGVTVIPVLEERLVVEKRLVLVEEIRIERHQRSETVTVPVTLRRQRVDVDRLPGDETDPHDPQDSEPSSYGPPPQTNRNEPT